MKRLIYRIREFIDDWIYPAHSLINLLFYRYVRIVIPQVRPWEYVDKTYLMLCANMELIVKFIEEEKPEEYICWYKDSNGEDVGRKYGEVEGMDYIYSEMNGRYIMDIIKEIYDWWKVGYPRLLEDKKYLDWFFSEYIFGKFEYEEVDFGRDFCMYELKANKNGLPKSVEDFERVDGIRWDIIDRYVEDRKMLLDSDKFFERVIKVLERRIMNEEQRYLHYCIEVRPYLWT